MTTWQSVLLAMGKRPSFQKRARSVSRLQPGVGLSCRRPPMSCDVSRWPSSTMSVARPPAGSDVASAIAEAGAVDAPAAAAVTDAPAVDAPAVAATASTAASISDCAAAAGAAASAATAPGAGSDVAATTAEAGVADAAVATATEAATASIAASTSASATAAAAVGSAVLCASGAIGPPLPRTTPGSRGLMSPSRMRRSFDDGCAALSRRAAHGLWMQRMNEEERVCGPVGFSRERQSVAGAPAGTILEREGEAHWAFLTGHARWLHLKPAQLAVSLFCLPQTST